MSRSKKESSKRGKRASKRNKETRSQIPHSHAYKEECKKIIEHLRKVGIPQSQEQLEAALRLRGAKQRKALHQCLDAMMREGQLLQNRRGQFIVINARGLIKGRVAGHPNGFGFLEPDEGESLTLDARQMRAVMDGDIAVARVAGIDRRGRKIGEIAEVIEHANPEVIGRYYEEAGVRFIVPENKRIAQQILVSDEGLKPEKNGMIVMGKIIEYPTLYRYAICEITEILGEYDQSGMETTIAARIYGIPVDWPEETLEAVEQLGDEVEEADKAGREDLRHLPFVTIDGDDARDFDDAIYAKKTATGWRLWVAIADVAHYVRPGSPLDQEAFKRGTSVYFPDSVVPMLPEKLSNGLCSLNPGVDRLAIVCELNISDEGRTRRSRFYRAVINSAERLNYDQVWALFSDPDQAIKEELIAPELEPNLQTLYALFHALYRARQERGTIDFETVETRVDFDEDRKIRQIVPIERNDAHRLIEECMITANVAAAQFLTRHKIPTLYRVHPGPKESRLERLKLFLGMFGLSLDAWDSPTPRDFARLLERIKDRPDFQLIQAVLLRTLSQADYRPENISHFGLALKLYCHFTSPIRRYPDLLIHQAIGHLIDQGKREEFGYTKEQMEALGAHCSMTERRAEEATRDALRALKCRFMEQHVGREFSGVISGVTPFGVFVELDDIYIDGLVHVTDLGEDYYHFDPTALRLLGERTGESFRLSDPIQVRVVRVDLEEKQIELIRLVSGVSTVRRGGRRPKKRR